MSESIQSTQTAVLFTEREHGTIIAALRNYQDFLRSGASPVPGLLDIANGAGEFSPLTAHEIEVLCEKVNFGSTAEELDSFVANAQAK